MTIQVLDKDGAPQTISTADDLIALIGAVTASPAANTMQDRLKAIVTALATNHADELVLHTDVGTTLHADLTALATFFGAKTDAKAVNTDATSISLMQVIKQVSASLQTLAAIVKAANSGVPSASGDAALAVTIRDVNTNGRKDVANSAPVVQAGTDYQDFSASTASTAVHGQAGSTGAVGDYLESITVFPESTSPGAITLQDGSSAAVTIFTGGASSVGSLVPFVIPLRNISHVGAWKIVTGAAVHVRVNGNFA